MNRLKGKEKGANYRADSDPDSANGYPSHAGRKNSKPPRRDHAGA